MNKRKELMSQLYDSVDYNNLKCQYVRSTNDRSFYEYKDSKELFNMIKIVKLNLERQRINKIIFLKN